MAVQTGAALSAQERIALIDAIAEATSRPVDLVDLNAVGEPLLGQILKYGQRLLGSDTDYAGSLSRHLFDAADIVPYLDRILRERRRKWIG